MRVLDKFISGLLSLLIKIYQKAIAPFFTSPCRHLPSCSNYGLEALSKHAKYFRMELGKRIMIRKIPEIVFVIDATYEKGKRIDDILKDLKK